MRDRAYLSFTSTHTHTHTHRLSLSLSYTHTRTRHTHTHTHKTHNAVCIKIPLLSFMPAGSSKRTLCLCSLLLAVALCSLLAPLLSRSSTMSDLADLRRAREARAELTALIKAAGGDMPEKDVLCVTVWPTHTHTHTHARSLTHMHKYPHTHACTRAATHPASRSLSAYAHNH